MTTTEYWTTVLLIALAIAVTVPVADIVREATPRAGPSTAGIAAAGALAIGSMLLPSGLVAASSAVPWLLVSTWSTSVAVRRSIGPLVAHIRKPTALIDLALPLGALVWWVNAAAWLVAHRAGLEPLGFTRPITLLTVAHFHHAGFGLSVLLTSAHLRLDLRPDTRTICVMHQVGMLVVAAGISLSDSLEVVGSIVITVALAGWAWLAVGPLRRQSGRAAQRLLAVSAASWVLPMGLAIGWASGPFLADPLVRTFETMIRFHGAINAIGLVLSGLVALTMHPPEPTIDHRLREDDHDHTHTTR